jgi:uncharacterized protein with ParB-like and HNH nuclease domain
MAVNPQGIGVQAAYRWYRNGQLQVNRRYQRKFVWTIEEKISLVESIIREYPIPQFIFAELREENRYEIIDGVQRLNAIFSLIENGFMVDGAYFDVG